MPKVKIRSIAEADIPHLVAIEKKITRREGPTPLERSIHNYIYYGDPELCLAAEAGSKVVGFLIGEVRPWEFGHEEIAWIKVVGVDPGQRRRGVGKALGEAFLAAVRAKGVHRVRTLVGQDAGGLAAYFRALGFGQGEQTVLERSL